jgi:alpha,alpha-trehalase
MKFLITLFACCACVCVIKSEDLPPPCSSEIYCHGKLIDSVMTARVFNDSKTYVDLKLKQPANVTLELFDIFLEKYNNKPTKSQLQQWVEENFDPTGSELEMWKPIDHNDKFEALNRIADKNFKQFAIDLNDIWIELSRKMKDEVKVSSNMKVIKEKF